MRSFAKILAFAVLVCFVAAASASAVGYDRYRSDGTPIADSQLAGQKEPGLWATIKKAACVDKYPGIIDGAVLSVKDVLGQFGLVEKKTP